MRKLKITPTFKQQLKKVSKYPQYDGDLLKQYLTMLQNGQELPPSARNHKLAKHSRAEYRGAYCFHLKPNICVVYKFNDEFVILIAIGSHQDLNLTESLV